VAAVANPDMQQTEQSVGTFAKGNPGITVTFDTLPEDQERAEISPPRHTVLIVAEVHS
jgi:hypothetical protein